MKLPNPDQALIPFEKLEGYSLNPNHSEGGHKARVFQSALGIGLEESEELRIALFQALKVEDAIPTNRTNYGQKYQIDFEMTRERKSAIIRSMWMIKPNEDFPRLITCYIP
ncbi:DUF6883 domain-containing protein [Laspinema palackyanum]|uniref:DUF6883 domain-containing protein n=1 Tax=Laspinema palackyanum TaxID=3231601 RepID=UPI00345E0100|nr:hypothetical protein [Laspinema sp. D2c]